MFYQLKQDQNIRWFYIQVSLMSLVLVLISLKWKTESLETTIVVTKVI